MPAYIYLALKRIELSVSICVYRWRKLFCGCVGFIAWGPPAGLAVWRDCGAVAEDSRDAERG